MKEHENYVERSCKLIERSFFASTGVSDPPVSSGEQVDDV